MKVAVVLPVFNNLGFTQKCFRYFDDLIFSQKFSHASFSVVVVDDGSTDGTGEWLLQNYPEVSVCKGDGNLWWSGGVNMGAKHAIHELNADYLLLWNNDVIPSDDFFQQIDRIVAEGSSDTLYGPKIYYAGEERIIWSCGGIFDPRKGRKYMLGFNQPENDAFNEPVDVDWLPGMGTLIPATVVNKIGYWDETYFPQYHGDSDYTLRAGEAGFRIVMDPKLILWNDKSNSGLTHGNRIAGLYRMMFHMRSNDHIGKNLRFYRRHATSPMAYLYLVRYYTKLTGGFFKWKVLHLAGKKRQ